MVNPIRARRQGAIRAAELIAERFAALLEDEEIDVVAHNSAVRLTGTGLLAGRTSGIVLGPLWLAKSSTSERLEMALRDLGQQVQRFFAKAGRDWPCDDAEMHVRITCASAELWWTHENTTRVAAKIRPIARADVGE